MRNWGLLILRVLVGLTFVGHGSQKLFGAFEGSGIEGTAKFMEALNLTPAREMAIAAGVSEAGGGLLLALGLLTPLGSLMTASSMATAIFKVTGKNGFWIQKNGYEYNLALIGTALMFALEGPGKYSLDNAFGLTREHK